MGITVEECLELEALRGAQIIAGTGGLNNMVSSVTVLEMNECKTRRPYVGNLLMITSFYAIKDDVLAQLEVVKTLHDVGYVGLVLYYVGMVLPSVDPMLIQVANERDFPLICMPTSGFENRYSDAITDIMAAVLRTHLNKEDYVKNLTQYISKFPPKLRTIDNLLRLLADKLRCTLLYTNVNYDLYSSAKWPMNLEINVGSLVEKIKSNPIIEGRKLLVGDTRAVYFECSPIYFENQNTMYLFFLSGEGACLTEEEKRQTVEILKLIHNFWNLKVENNKGHDFMAAIFNDNPMLVKMLALQLSVEPSRIQRLWVFHFINSDSMSNSQLRKVKKLMTTLKQFFDDYRINAVYDVFENHVVALIEASSYFEAAHPFADTFMRLARGENEKLILTHASRFSNISEIRDAYFMMQAHGEYAIKIYPTKYVLSNYEMTVVYKAKAIIDEGEMSVEKRMRVLKPLMVNGRHKNNELIVTLATFLLDARSSLNVTSRLLYLHNSTIKYRLKKIKDKLGFDITELPESYELYVALAVYRLVYND